MAKVWSVTVEYIGKKELGIWGRIASRVSREGKTATILTAWVGIQGVRNTGGYSGNLDLGTGEWGDRVIEIENQISL